MKPQVPKRPYSRQEKWSGEVGTITLIGYTSDGTAKMNVNWIIDNEVTIKTVFRYRNIYPTIIEAVSKGMIPLKEIASDIYDFSDIQRAMDHSIDNKDKVTKMCCQDQS